MLYFIPTPIGNLEDISLRSLRLLERASIVFCEDTRVTKKLFSLLREKREFDPPPQKFVSLHSHNEKSVLNTFSPDQFINKTVVYVSDAGMPALSDPGCELIQYAQKHGIGYDVLPGANAALLAFISSGFCDGKFLFYGFLPHKGSARTKALDEVLFNGFVTIVYESPHRIIKLVEQICNIDEKRELFLIKEATKLHQKHFKAKAIEILDMLKVQNIKGEWTVVINSDKKELGVVTADDILSLDIPKKQASKLLSKITGKSPKQCYNELL